MRKLFNQIKFAFQANQFSLLFKFAILAALILLVFRSQTIPDGATSYAPVFEGFNWWANWLDPFVGTFTFLVAFGVWWTTNLHQWEDKLQKRLTIHYLFNRQEIMRCEEVYLASEGDIRSWAQQLGAQLSNTRFLKFEPFMEEAPARILFDEVSGQYYILYQATIFLTDRPINIGLSDTQLDAYHLTQQYTNKNGVVVWSRKNIPTEIVDQT